MLIAHKQLKGACLKEAYRVSFRHSFICQHYQHLLSRSGYCYADGNLDASS